MANSKLHYRSEGGGVTTLQPSITGVSGDVILPESGELATKDYADLKQSKSELAYNVDTSSYIPNTLASGAIIERGSNANGKYVKYADGTMICTIQNFTLGAVNISSGSLYRSSSTTWTFPHNFTDVPTCNGSYTGNRLGNVFSENGLTSEVIAYSGGSNTTLITANLTAIGRWK